MVTVSGSHKHSCLFGALSLDGRQLFKQYDNFDEDTFYDYLKRIHYKFQRCYLFLDKAHQHYKSKKVRKYFDEHKNEIIPVWLPTASPEFMVLEECWNLSKNDLLVLTYYQSFTDFRIKTAAVLQNQTFQTQHEKLSGWKEELENLCYMLHNTTLV